MGDFVPVVAIGHAAFEPARHETLKRVIEQLGDLPYYVHEEHERRGALAAFRGAMSKAAQHEGATHLVYLPDDAILQPDYAETLRAVIAAKPGEIICGFANHDKAAEAYADGARWYTTHDGAVMLSGVMPLADWHAHVAWRHRELASPWLDRMHGGVSDDEGVNLWAMCTGRLIHKPLPSLADHYAPDQLPSLMGNDGHSARRPYVLPEPRMAQIDWTQGETAHLGKTYAGMVWGTCTKILDGAKNIERAHMLAGGREPSRTASVFIAAPDNGGGDVKRSFSNALDLTTQDLLEHGIPVAKNTTIADSAVQRARNRMVREFLCSGASHLLFWDADVVPSEPDYVRRMVLSGHDVVGGGYPAKDGEGRLIVSLFGHDHARGYLELDEHGCTPVLDIGTGFLLITRRAILAMAKRLWDRVWYLSDFRGDHGALGLALFEFEIEHGTRRYLSEDYVFCRRWQEMGGHVHLFAEAEFAHVGSANYGGNIHTHLRGAA